MAPVDGAHAAAPGHGGPGRGGGQHPKLAGLASEVAVFGHGGPLKGRAVERFREFAAR